MPEGRSRRTASIRGMAAARPGWGLGEVGGGEEEEGGVIKDKMCWSVSRLAGCQSALPRHNKKGQTKGLTKPASPCGPPYGHRGTSQEDYLPF